MEGLETTVRSHLEGLALWAETQEAPSPTFQAGGGGARGGAAW